MSEEKRRKKIFDSMCKLDQAKILRYEGKTGRELSADNLLTFKALYDDVRKAQKILDDHEIRGSLRMVHLNFARILHRLKKTHGGLALKKMLKIKKTEYKAYGCKIRLLNQIAKAILE